MVLDTGFNCTRARARGSAVIRKHRWVCSFCQINWRRLTAARLEQYYARPYLQSDLFRFGIGFTEVIFFRKI